MAFYNKSVLGNGGEKVLWSTDSVKEGSIHSAFIQNTTDSVGSFTLRIGGLDVLTNITLAPKEVKVLEKPVNISTNQVVSVVMSSGVNGLFSLLESSVDPNAALSTVAALVSASEQYRDQAMVAAANAANNVASLLPYGSVLDDVINLNTTWSSQKINTQIASGAFIDCGNAGTIFESTLDCGGV